MTAFTPPGREVATLPDMLDRAAGRWPDRLALVSGERRCRFAELRDASLVAEAELRRLGAGRGDRVVVVIDEFVDAIAMMFGVARLGGVYVLMNGDTTEYAAGHVMRDCEPVLVLAERDSPARRTAVSLGLPVAAPPCFGRPAPPPEPWRPGPISRDLVSVLYTSGSTGRPKGVAGTHRNMVFAAHAIARRFRLREDDVIGCVLPLAFDYGVYQILLSMIAGCPLVWGKGTDAGPGLLNFLDRHGITVLPSVPGLAHNLDRLSRRSPGALPPLRVLTNTGAAMSADLLGRLRDRYPRLEVFLMFGLTECKRISILLPEELPRKPGSVGRPLDDTECVIVDPEGRPLAPGEVGELVVRGPHVTQGYWGDPEGTALRFRPWGPNGEVALFTGDQCWLDDEGYLYFQGRDDDIYKSNGFRVSATEVAMAAEEVPGVLEAYCAAARGDDPPVLAVVTELTAMQVRVELQKHLEWYKVPDLIVPVDRLPLNRNGKVDGPAVRALAGSGRPV
ncbi:class I adenylate-forming enzyme family protein [Actinomadura rugatobispora]|uniref:Class I adenylate-forming enzyme family protein n=1 Tax=Actinomadura rugatobispora TaxID=1994 RepID=A0ABW0ZPA1_9ACTN|nr:class I adenylate-forming enzyme family protein [Actinomadura rugatobispora]